MTQITYYSYKPIISSLLKLSTPMVFAKLSIPIRGLALTWILAQLGTNSLAAGSLVFTLYISLNSFLLGVIISSVGVLTAYAAGAEDKNEMTHVIQQGVWLGLILATPAFFILYHAAFIFEYFNQNPVVISLAKEYCHTLAWSFFPYSIGISIYKLWINIHKSYAPMLYVFIGFVLTVSSSYSLAFGAWGLPVLGIAGVGLGMSLGGLLQIVLCILHTSLSKVMNDYPIFIRLSLPDSTVLKKLWRIGWPVGLKYNIEFFLFFVIATIIGKNSNEQLAVYQIILQFFMLASCLGDALGLCVQVLVGQAIGANHQQRVLPIFLTALLLVTLYMSVVIILILFNVNRINHYFFHSIPDTYRLFTNGLVWISFFILIDGLQKVMAEVMIALKQSTIPLITEIIGLWCTSLPLGYVMLTYIGNPLQSFLISLVLGLLLSLLLMGYYFYQKTKNFIVCEIPSAMV